MEEYIQENMKIIRNIVGYTQADLAKTIGVSRVHYIQIETGQIKIGRIVAIAFMTIVTCLYKKLDEDSPQYNALKQYVNEFRYFTLNLV